MKITIDEKICDRHKITPQELMLAVVIRSSQNYDQLIEDMLDKQILVYRHGEYLVTQRWSDEIDNILIDSLGKPDDENHLTELAKKLREHYPSGQMPGTSFYYRGNVREIANKLKKFFIQYGKYKDEDILEATDRYVNSFNGDYHFLPLLKYFISKQKKKMGEDGNDHIEEVSQLASYLENKDTPKQATDDWTVTLK